MAYVITDTCIKDSLCVEVCPTDCIHPKTDEPGFEAATQMYVDPEGCIDCGACIPACTSDSIHALEDVPEEKKDFIEKNAAGGRTQGEPARSDARRLAAFSGEN